MFPSLATSGSPTPGHASKKSKRGRPTNASRMQNMDQNSSISSLPAIVSRPDGDQIAVNIVYHVIFLKIKFI